MRLGVLALLMLPAFATAQPLEAVARAKGHPVLPGVYRLDGTDPGLPQADLEPLRKIVGRAPIVALGEAIHTSGGFYEMKHRVFRFLVEKMGFRAFAIETPWIDAERVSQYVQTCEGTPEAAIRGLFTVWQSAEVRDLVQWMCDWNRGHRRRQDKIHFFGFDIQQPEKDRPALLASSGLASARTIPAPSASRPARASPSWSPIRSRRRDTGSASRASTQSSGSSTTRRRASSAPPRAGTSRAPG